MFWGDRIKEEIHSALARKIESGEPLIVRDEKTASGRVHVGSMRGVAIHGLITEILNEAGIAARFLYEINDFDPMDGLPVYLDAEQFRPHMGKPLCDVPSPDGQATNFAEYFADEFRSVIEATGFTPEFYRSSEVYRSGRYNDVIRLALENADKIREIYRRVSGSVKPEDWMPLQVVCEACGRIGTTKVVSFDGEEVAYRCLPDLVTWAVGCGYEGRVSPFDGNAKLPWKVEWAAKFRVMGVDVEGAGKDHSTKGGARDIANVISREIFGYEPPFDIPYEFFLVGGKKMSSSKGSGSSSKEVSDLLPPHLFRFLLISKDPKRVIDFIPDGDTIPILYDLHDKYAEGFFAGAEDDYSRAFLLSLHPNTRGEYPARFLPRFSQVAFLVQMPHMDYFEEIARLKGGELTALDRKEAEERSEFARRWLAEYAPESYRYELQEEVPEAAKELSDLQRAALRELLSYVEDHAELDGQELHTELHEIRKRTGVPPRDFFSALYIAFLGKESGPKAGWFLSVLERGLLERRLREITA